MIDTHAHLDDERYAQDLAETLARASAAGVDRTIVPGVETATHAAVLDLCRAHAGTLFPAVGLHPISVNENPQWREDLDTVAALLADPANRYIAIGETGLDYYRSRDFIPQQKEAFRAQLTLAAQHNLPLILHIRDAWNDCLDILEELLQNPVHAHLRGVVHAFSETAVEAGRLVRLGPNWYAGIGGRLTYKNSTLPEATRVLNLEKIILETDAPYLPPQGHRGERNEPAYVAIIAAKLAEIFDTTVDEVDRITTQNAEKLFYF